MSFEAEKFFESRGWKPFPFQKKVWEHYAQGQSGLLHVPTGAGKTFAAVLGPMMRYLKSPRKGLKLLYITPLRALSRDLALAIDEPIKEQKWPLTVGVRTGDTPNSVRLRQIKHPPDILLTTPESLAVMIARADSQKVLANIDTVILDEWHELLSTKRGSLMELNLSYLRSLNPHLQTWALSASIGNLNEAAQVALGVSDEPLIISDHSKRIIDIDCLLPDKIDAFPWAGHLGFALKNKLFSQLDRTKSTLIFTNTRSQAERWYSSLLESVPDMAEQMALHHGSVAREERERIEEGVKIGALKWVVCTSALDLGVDFQAVEQVVQIGSPKMVARFMQRAGRSAHRPQATSRLLFVPTNSWEIFELEAIRNSLENHSIEVRPPLFKPIDVLIQHMMSLACGPGLQMDQLAKDLKRTMSFSTITEEELDWCLQFLTVGGKTLKAYPQFRKLIEKDGAYRFSSVRLAMQHRMSIGTIVTRESVQIAFTNRRRLGSVEESFISRFKKGDVFQFAGKKLELFSLKDMTAYVKASTAPCKVIPSWAGNRFPLSEILSSALRKTLNQRHPNLERLLAPLLKAQRENSELPNETQLLIECWTSRKGKHLFVFPFEGQLVHEGLSQLWAHRFASRKPSTFSFAVNDYGFEILGPEDYDFEGLFDDEFFSDAQIEKEIPESMHLSELQQRHFREIASIAGLVFTGFPGKNKTGRQMQISSSLLYDVFRKYEPDNLLYKQAQEEVLKNALQSDRMRRTLKRMSGLEVLWKNLSHPSPLSFPLFIEMENANHLSNESIEMKVARLQKAWKKSG